MVLASSSPYLSALLRGEEEENEEALLREEKSEIKKEERRSSGSGTGAKSDVAIFLHDISNQELELLISFLYTGQVTFESRESQASFQKLLTSLRVKNFSPESPSEKSRRLCNPGEERGEKFEPLSSPLPEANESSWVLADPSAASEDLAEPQDVIHSPHVSAQEVPQASAALSPPPPSPTLPQISFSTLDKSAIFYTFVNEPSLDALQALPPVENNASLDDALTLNSSSPSPSTSSSSSSSHSTASSQKENEGHSSSELDFIVANDANQIDQDGTEQSSMSSSSPSPSSSLQSAPLATLQSTAKKSRKLFTCKVCEKSFPSAHYLKFHERSVHATNKTVECTDCDKAFSGEYYLRQHRKRMHSASRPFVCDHPACGSSFSVRYDLVVHLRTHAKVKQFACTFCDKTYATQRALREHKRTHTGERPFECNDCGKRFALPKTLRVHYRQHSGERPYLCSHCGMTFVQNSTLRNHLRNHHLPTSKVRKPKEGMKQAIKAA